MSTFSSLSAAPVRSVAGPRLTGYWIALTILVVDQATKYLVHTYTPYGWSQPVTSFFKATLNKPSKISAQTWMTQFFGLLCLSRGPFGQFAGR